MCMAEVICWDEEDASRRSSGKPFQVAPVGSQLLLTFICHDSFYNATTHNRVAVKKMHKKYRRYVGTLLENEASALLKAQSWEVPRVVELIGPAPAQGGMDCLVLE